MAIKELVLRKRIEEKRTALAKLQEAAKDLETREAELAAREAELEEALEEVSNDEEKAAFDEALEAYEKDKEELDTAKEENAKEGAYFTNRGGAEKAAEMFRQLNEHFKGQDIQFCYDIHEHLSPIEALQFAKAVEPYNLFFLEDALSPENSDWFKLIRQQSYAPIAMGELFTNPAEYKHLIQEGLIDYIRCHITMIGGITPAKKLATFAELYGVKTAWHGPHDISPVGVMAQLHLDVNVPNFGIQEFFGFSKEEKELFPGYPEARNGYLYPNDRPGLGIDFDEKLAKECPAQFREHAHDWFLTRLPDGTPVRP